ncbi:MAG: amidohydrolase/deacetylase family metallohydrolase [SAR202 cluster bacterium]|nr:amidohydrolase/deacetylase family metallohydrolase [SAR202 cluster bacterium]
MPYDLLIKGGRVLDPGQGLDGPLDIAIANGDIAAIRADIPPAEATRVMQLKGQLVVPGMIDMHIHFIQGAATPGLNEIAGPPDLAGVQSGVTTVLDAGTTGAWNFGVYPHYVVGKTQTRLLCMLNIGKMGIPGQALRKPEIYTTEDVDIDATVKVVSMWPKLIQGIKLRLVGPALESMGVKLIELAKEAGRETKRPLMVHLGDLISHNQRAGEVTKALLRALEPGDIVTHVCTSVPGGVLDGNKRVLPELREAEQRGVVFDPAHGRSGFNFEVAQRLAEQDFHPSTISTDITINGRKGPIHSLTETMSKFLALGYSLPDVIAMVTTNAAKALRRENDLGALAVGRVADISILDVVNGKWRFRDSQENVFHGEQALVPVHTVRAGKPISLDWGPHPWGWLPEDAAT